MKYKTRSRIKNGPYTVILLMPTDQEDSTVNYNNNNNNILTAQ